MKDKAMISYILPMYQAEQFVYENIDRFSKYCFESDIDSEIIVVNDGSTDKTNEMIEAFLRDNKGRYDSLIKYLNLKENIGKGAAIRKGFEVSEGQYIVFTDGDLQYSFENIYDLVSALIKGDANMVLANRMHKDSIYKIKSENLTYIYVRHTAGRIYNWLINFFARLNIEDTQAGLKGFDRETAELIFNRMTVLGFAFDIDILSAAKENNKKIQSIPIMFNYDEEMSTVNFIKQIFIMTFDLCRILIKRITGSYRK